MDGLWFLPNAMQVLLHVLSLKEDLVGEWEIIRIQEPPLERSLEAGQILWGEGDLRNGEQALSARVVLEADGSVGDATWEFNVQKTTS